MKETLAQLNEKDRKMKSNVTTITCDTSDVPNFTLNSPGAFASRSNDVFGRLQSLERNHETWMSENAVVDTKDHSQNADATKTDVEVFKKPVPTRDWKRKRTSVPLFKRPRRIWKKYSLEDVPVASDAKNTAIALQCISELRKRKKNDADRVNSDMPSGKIVFTKPVLKIHKAESSNKLNHEEIKDSKSPKITLQHLQDE